MSIIKLVVTLMSALGTDTFLKCYQILAFLSLDVCIEKALMKNSVYQKHETAAESHFNATVDIISTVFVSADVPG